MYLINVKLFVGKFFFANFGFKKILLALNFCILLWMQSNLMIVIVVSPAKLIFAVLEQIAEIASISTRNNL